MTDVHRVVGRVVSVCSVAFLVSTVAETAWAEEESDNTVESADEETPGAEETNSASESDDDEYPDESEDEEEETLAEPEPEPVTTTEMDVHENITEDSQDREDGNESEEDDDESDDNDDDDEEEEEEEDEDEETGQHCVGQPHARWVYHQMLVLKYNPLGAEHYGRVGVCAPFVRGRGTLFDYSNIELGISHALSPAGFHLGGYVQLAPLSFLILRANVEGMMYWEFPVDRAGYFAAQGYDDSIDSDNYPAEQATVAGGWMVNLWAILQAKVSMGRLALIILNAFTLELWHVGDAPYYVNLRHDVIMAQSDWLIANEGMLLLEIPVHRSFNLRIGAYDALRHVPGSGQPNNNVGGLAMLNWPSIGNTTRELNLFLRVGAYTHRPPQERGRAVIYLGLSYDFDLGAVSGSTSPEDS